MGCSNDVLDIADMKCSGRHRCEIYIPYEPFEKTKPCYQELKSHFEASYRCVKGRSKNIALELLAIKNETVSVLSALLISGELLKGLGLLARLRLIRPQHIVITRQLNVWLGKR